MTLRELYHPEKGIMRMAGLISGSGSNLRKIIEHEKRLYAEKGKSPYKVVVIFSDKLNENATRIGMEYGIPVIARDIVGFYRERGKSRRDLSVRNEFDELVVAELKPFKIDVAAYAGYMSIASKVLTDAFLGINVHPADLSIMENGKRKYTGDHAVLNAIGLWQQELRSTTHIVEREVDNGRILMISSPLKVELPKEYGNYDIGAKAILIRRIAEEHQQKLKEVGDWVIFPKTLEYIADGRYSQDEEGNLYFDGKSIPFGLKLE